MFIRRQRRLAILAVPAFLLTVAYFLLPNDNTARLAVRFGANTVLKWTTIHPDGHDPWTTNPGPYSVHINTDVGFLIKTGYGTRHRIPAQMAALGFSPESDSGRRFVVVGDFDRPANATPGWPDIHDAVAGTLAEVPETLSRDSHRKKKHDELTAAVEMGDRWKAKEIGTVIGWELDAMKFVWGLKFAHDTLPPKKWYAIIDDDTYILRPSLERILSHLDASKPYYLGNAVGDYKARFAHGGSAILLSAPAVNLLMAQPHVLAEAHVRALDETWGDRLLATCLQKAGVYLDERTAQYFNGDAPRDAKIRPDRACATIVSFHELKTRRAMTSVSKKFGSLVEPIRWGHLWNLYGGTSLDELSRHPTKEEWTYVGRPDESCVHHRDVKYASECHDKCIGPTASDNRCLAWQWDKQSKDCHLCPWVSVGRTAPGLSSGVSVEHAGPLFEACAKKRMVEVGDEEGAMAAQQASKKALP